MNVLVSCQALYDLVDLARIDEIQPGVRIECVPFSLSPHEQAIRERAPHDHYADELTSEQRDAFAAAEAIVTLHAPGRLSELAPNLRWLHCLGSGVGHLVPTRLDPERVLVTNSAGASAVSIAEFVVARILEDYKRLHEYADLQRARTWRSSPGRTLADATVLVVGFGGIGRGVGQRLRAFGVHVVALRKSWRPGQTDPDVDELYGADALDDVLERADVVVLAVPGTDATRNMIDARRLRAMRPDALLVNVGRGTLVDEVALEHALRSGDIRAAALDVVRDEPLPPDSPLWTTPGVRTPHSAGDHRGSYRGGFDIFCENLAALRDGRPLRNLVDISGR